ncbi:hypothetical protein BDF22DRAFT_739665 [Syncephalis plumigaleata]|nr:hypothetical protein BDF22DRAFT_739665 [Syncephalis plumigaleata]
MNSVTEQLENLRNEARRRQLLGGNGIGISTRRLQQPEHRQVAGWSSNATTDDSYAVLAWGGTAGLLGAQPTINNNNNNGIGVQQANGVRNLRPRQPRPIAGPPPPPSWQQPGHVRRRRRGKSDTATKEISPQESRPNGLRAMGQITSDSGHYKLLVNRRHELVIDTISGVDQQFDEYISNDRTMATSRTLSNRCIQQIACHITRYLEEIPYLPLHIKQHLLWEMTLGRYIRNDKLYWTSIDASLLELFLDINYTALYLAGTDVDNQLLEYFLKGMIVDIEEPVMIRVIIVLQQIEHQHQHHYHVLPIANPPHYSLLSHLDLRGCRRLSPRSTARLLVQHVPLLRTLRLGGCFESSNKSVRLTNPTLHTTETVTINPHAITCLQRLATGLIELRVLDLAESSYISLLAVQAIFNLKSYNARTTTNDRASGKLTEWPRIHTVILSGCPAVDGIGKKMHNNHSPALSTLPAIIQMLLKQRSQLALIV